MGMKSGIRSMGLNVCATTKKINAFAYQGVRGSFAARYTANASFFKARARCLRRSSMSGNFSSNAIKHKGADHIPKEQIDDQKNSIGLGTILFCLAGSPGQIKLEWEPYRKRI